MAATDLQEWIDSNFITGWEWSETNGWVSAQQLRHTPPLGHLYAYCFDEKPCGTNRPACERLIGTAFRHDDLWPKPI